ncbi:hypothetical protein [Winogradskyella sp. SYSU M77433]|uniref:hypothetical protein n=1 Tax=Winogradskyella sp. SYSU M77433 TaxID=3042722 RepID=UPI00247FE6C2|nr:hypothetical protein [Winogradskyella sp. SYSU M77433]MDH7913877.1 hypothetical protein [Winogradskyella sp. SYSU M77433]
MPTITLCILMNYVYVKKSKTNLIYSIGLLALFTSDIFATLAFKDSFLKITILTTTYIVCSTLALKKYLKRGKLKSFLSITSFITIGLLTYIVYAILDLLVLVLPKNTLFFVFLSVLTLIVLLVTIGLIYFSNNYRSGTMLLASGIFFFVQVCLSVINEFLYNDKTFISLIIFCHTMAIYLLTRFLIYTKAIKTEDIKEWYL